MGKAAELRLRTASSVAGGLPSRLARDLRQDAAGAVCAIITAFPARDNTMEAEQLNAITHHLQDLRARAGELRRYL